MRPALPLQPPLKRGSLHLIAPQNSSRRPPFFLYGTSFKIRQKKKTKISHNNLKKKKIMTRGDEPLEFAWLNTRCQHLK